MQYIKIISKRIEYVSDVRSSLFFYLMRETETELKWSLEKEMSSLSFFSNDTKSVLRNLVLRYSNAIKAIPFPLTAALPGVIAC